MSTLDKIIGSDGKPDGVVNVTFQPLVVYPLVAARYFAVCWPISFAAGRLGARLDARGARA